MQEKQLSTIRYNNKKITEQFINREPEPELEEPEPEDEVIEIDRSVVDGLSVQDEIYNLVGCKRPNNNLIVISEKHMTFDIK